MGGSGSGMATLAEFAGRAGRAGLAAGTSRAAVMLNVGGGGARAAVMAGGGSWGLPGEAFCAACLMLSPGGAAPIILRQGSARP